MNNKFNASKYWEERLSNKYDLSSVGWESLGKYYNYWLYFIKKNLFHRTINGLNISPSKSKILDIGSGTGFYIDRWIETGATQITGCDITKTATINLRDKYNLLNFDTLDIGAPLKNTLLENKKFDLVSCFDVLYHIVEDESFDKAISNISSLLSTEGLFIFTDTFLRHEEIKSEHVKCRKLEEYQRILDENGFLIISRLPASILSYPPTDTKISLFSNIWYAFTLPIRLFKPLGFIYGLILAPLEINLTKYIKEGPGLEIMICKKKKHVNSIPKNTGNR